MFKKLISPGIALISAVLITLLVPKDALTIRQHWTLLLLSFTVVYATTYLVTEYLIFRELRKLEDLLKPRLDDKSVSPETNPGFHLPNMKNAWNYITILLHQKNDQIKKLEQMADFRKRFIGDVSHELKSPIFAAQGYIHTLLDGALKDKEVRVKFLNKAGKSIDYMDSLVQDLLLLSQIETGGVTMLFDYFDLIKLVEEVFDHFEHRAAKKAISLELKYDLSPIVVFADYSRILQVMQNLVSNAIKYNKERGNVTIHLKEHDETIQIDILDNGIGIPKKDVNNIFNRFYRVDISRSKKSGGTGLGLAIVKHLLDSHNSKIEVKSTLGKGTTFTFTLPKHKRWINEPEV